MEGGIPEHCLRSVKLIGAIEGQTIHAAVRFTREQEFETVSLAAGQSIGSAQDDQVYRSSGNSSEVSRAASIRVLARDERLLRNNWRALIPLVRSGRAPRSLPLHFD